LAAVHGHAGKHGYDNRGTEDRRFQDAQWVRMSASFPKSVLYYGKEEPPPEQGRLY